MNCAFIVRKLNGANPHDFQRVGPGANLLSHLFAFYASNHYLVGKPSTAEYFTSFDPLGAGEGRRQVHLQI